MRAALALFILLPYLLIIPHLQSWDLKYSLSEVTWVMGNTITQIAGTIFVAVALGVGIFWSLLGLRPLWSHLGWLVVIPFLSPVLLVIGSFFAWLPGLSMGNQTVAWVQGYAFAGFLGFNLYRYYLNNLGPLESSARVLGVRGFHYWKAIGPLLWRPLSFQMGLCAFFALTSFSVPLMLGGQRGVNLEVFIFEKLRFESDLTQAFSLSLLQLAIVIIFELIRRTLSSGRDNVLEVGSKITHSAYVPRWSIVFVLCYLVFFLRGSLEGAFLGLPKFIEVLLQSPQIGWAIGNSVVLGVAVTAVLCAALLLVSALALISAPSATLGYWMAPTAAILGVALWPWADSVTGLVLVVAYLFIFLPALAKSGLGESLHQLRAQVLVAQGLGISELRIWAQVIVPQVWPQARFLAAIGGFWAILDYGIARLFVTQSDFLAGLTIQGWLGAYRYYEAMGLLFCLSVIGLVGVGWAYAKSDIYK